MKHSINNIGILCHKSSVILEELYLMYNIIKLNKSKLYIEYYIIY